MTTPPSAASGRASPGSTRPVVTLAYAQSLDGSLAPAKGGPLALSCPETLVLTHELRAAHDAILVGIGTVLADDPQLTVRHAAGPDPRPVVLDSRLRLPETARVLAHPRGAWVATTDAADAGRQRRLETAGARIWRLPSSHGGLIALPPLLRRLRELGIRRLMVEGGSRVIASFLNARLVDHLVVTIAPCLVGGLPAVAGLACPPRLRHVSYQPLGADLVLRADLEWPAD